MKLLTRAAIVLAIGGLALAAAACSSDDPTPTPTLAPDKSEGVPLNPSATPISNQGGDPTPTPTVEPTKVEVLAPIESVELLIAESFPPQYFLEVVSGLPNSCAEFNGYDVARDGTTIRITVNNLVPAPGELVLCALVYGTQQHNIALGTDFEPGTTYTAVVNGVTETFVAQ